MTFFNDQYIQNWKRSQQEQHARMLKESIAMDSLRESYQNFSPSPDKAEKYDIFLSHRYEDKKLESDEFAGANPSVF